MMDDLEQLKNLLAFFQSRNEKDIRGLTRNYHQILNYQGTFSIFFFLNRNERERERERKSSNHHFSDLRYVRVFEDCRNVK